MNTLDTEKNGKTGHGRLFLRTYLAFGAVIVAFAVILGVIFLRLFERANIADYRKNLIEQTERTSAKCTELLKKNSPNEWVNYLISLREIRQMEVWIWTNKDASEPLWPILSVDPDNNSLATGYAEAARKAFTGEVVVTTLYNDSKNNNDSKNKLLCAVPVYGKTDEAGIVGAVIMAQDVDATRGLTDIGTRVILLSIVIALAVTFVIAIPVVRAITHPISRIRSTAMTLAEGDYTAKTGLDRRDEIGELASTIDFLSDKLAENEIERQNIEQTRRDFFANVSHELRTPLTVVRAYAESLKDGVVTKPEKVQQYYDRMLEECKSMERLVGDLLTLSKMQNPDFVIEKEPVDLKQVMMDMIRAAKALADEKGIRIKYSRCDGPCIIDADYGRLKQMFLVIVDNAVKFSNEGGEVRINIERSGDNIIVSIRDDGVGISEEELPYIFEKFYKSKLRQNAKGSGLGLAIAKQICLKHNGTINVKSEVGKGTCFTFVFPRKPDMRAER